MKKGAALIRSNARLVRKAVREHEALVEAWRAEWVRQLFPPAGTPSPSSSVPVVRVAGSGE